MGMRARVHMGLLMRAVDALKEDERVLGLYVSGNPDTDEFSDVDLMIVSKREDIRSLEEDRYMIASKVGEIRSEAMALKPHTYVVNYEEGVKMDYCFHVYPERPRPDKAYIDIIYARASPPILPTSVVNAFDSHCSKK